MAKKPAMPKGPTKPKPKEMPKSMGKGGTKGKPSMSKEMKAGKPTY